MATRNHGVNLSYKKTRDILTVAFLAQFPASYERSYAEHLARELAEELLRPALSPAARKRLDAIKATETHAKHNGGAKHNGKVAAPKAVS